MTIFTIYKRDLTGREYGTYLQAYVAEILESNGCYLEHYKLKQVMEILERYFVFTELFSSDPTVPTDAPNHETN
jgi:hypothetical protein